MDKKPQESDLEEASKFVTEESDIPEMKSEDEKPSKGIKLNNKNYIIIAVLSAFLVLGLGLTVLMSGDDGSQKANQENEESQLQSETFEGGESEQNSDLMEESASQNRNSTQTSEVLDLTALPLGNDLYSDSAQQGRVFSCNTSFTLDDDSSAGSWISVSAGTWDLTSKISVSGTESWPAAFFEVVEGTETRTIRSANLPLGHTTGTFPVDTDDEAYQFNQNPNSIAIQDITLEVPLNPEVQETPTCIDGEVGVATTGVLIFSALDSAGRDAYASEINDDCQGQPQSGSYYHYHGYSLCFNDTSAEGEHSDLLGYALDGFGIYGLKGEDGKEMTSADLDECHGHTHEIEWNGEMVEMYHYHFTRDFPYSVSCFRGEPVVKTLSSEVGGALEGNQQGQEVGQEDQDTPPDTN